MITDFPTDALAAVDKDDRRPAYTQIADQLRRLILERHVTPGTQLPVEPVLVDRFGVSRMTVREGIRVLRLEGLLRTNHGIGVFVATYPGAVPLAGTIRIRTRRPDNPRHRYIDAEVTDSDWQPPVAANHLSSHLEAALDSIGPNQTVTIDIRVDHKPPETP